MIQSSSLFLQLTERELHSRFAGRSLGLLWALINPLVLLAIYSFVFSELLRPGLPQGGAHHYTLFVAIGLWPWMMFADGVMRGMVSIQSNAALVKKIAFPHVYLLGASVTAAFATHLLGYALVLFALAAAGNEIKLSGIPIAAVCVLLLFAFTMGVAALLSGLQTVLHDVEMAVTPAITMLHFLTPVIYPLAMIPERYRHYLEWNPVAVLIEGIRGALLPPVAEAAALGMGAPFVIALAIVAAGTLVFSRLSPYFEDFL